MLRVTQEFLKCGEDLNILITWRKRANTEEDVKDQERVNILDRGKYRSKR